MDWTKDISLLFEPLRELSHYWQDDAARRVMSDGVPHLSELAYDNWNGGTTTYTLVIQIPVPLYATIESRLEAIEKELLERIQRLQREETNDHVAQVVIKPQSTVSNKVVPLHDSKFWLPNHFRLFISHLNKDKRSAGNLKGALTRYGISAFVAHEDIAPTKEWLDEIEKALFSMDALAAILSPGFHNSNWTDHEVGFSLGRGVLVLPIRYGLDPYGLIGKYQGLQAKDRHLREVAKSVFDALLLNPQTRAKLVGCLVDQFVVCGSREIALAKLELLLGAEEVLPEGLAKIRERTSNSDALAHDEEVLKTVNELLVKYGAEPVSPKRELADVLNDDIPF